MRKRKGFNQAKTCIQDSVLMYFVFDYLLTSKLHNSR